MTQISILEIVESTTVDGPGLRTSIYAAGCVNRCLGCHNPQSWDIDNGKWTDIDEILDKIKEEDFCNVSFSGGDPMYQAEAFTELAKRIKQETGKTIWCYTGYTIEEVMNDPVKKALMENVDVIVDGRFIESEKEDTLVFCGSRNQRIIDVHATLRRGEVVLLDIDSQVKIHL